MDAQGQAVVDRQNSLRGLKLLRARSEVYRQAKSLQKLQLLLTVVAPLVGAVLGIICPDARPYVATLSLTITVLDAGLLDRAQRNRLKFAAKVSEEFDTEILDLPWSAHVAGAHPTPEEITRAANAWQRGDEKLHDWYPKDVGKAPLHLARAICQRTNLWYDAELRRQYSGILLAVSLTSFAVLFVIGLVRQITLIDFAATILAPAAPILVWTLRDFYRQRDAAEAQSAARAEVEQMWALVLAGDCGAEECARRARELQNTIYSRRSSNPLVIPGLYNRLRPRLEAQMNAGAAELLAQAGIDTVN